MKKTYLSPATETMVLLFSPMMTEDQSANKGIDDGFGSSLFTPAPERKQPF